MIGLSGMARAALALLLFSACESAALSLDDPNALNVRFEPEFVEADQQGPLKVQVTFETQDPDNDTGAVATFQILQSELPEGLVISSWTFLSNFRLEMDLLRAADAERGTHDILLQVRNHFGVFLARGKFTVL